MNEVSTKKSFKKTIEQRWFLIVLVLILLIFGSAFIVLRAKAPRLLNRTNELGLLRSHFESGKNYSPAIGYDFPPLRLEGTGGSLIDTRTDLQKKPTLVVFEATWCTYCKEELADLNRIATEGKVNYLSIDIHEPRAMVDTFVKENGINHPWYYDEDGSVTTWFLLAGTPTHLIVGADGKIVTRLTGYQTGQQLDAAIASALAK